jgi:hypothetical protein
MSLLKSVLFLMAVCRLAGAPEPVSNPPLFHAVSVALDCPDAADDNTLFAAVRSRLIGRTREDAVLFLDGVVARKGRLAVQRTRGDKGDFLRMWLPRSGSIYTYSLHLYYDGAGRVRLAPIAFESFPENSLKEDA